MSETELIDQFVAITGASPHIAQHILEAHAFDLEPSVNFYLESGGVGHGNDGIFAEYDDHSTMAPSPAPRPLPASAAPRSSPLEVFDDVDEDLRDDRVLAANLARRRAARRAVEDVIADARAHQVLAPPRSSHPAVAPVAIPESVEDMSIATSSSDVGDDVDELDDDEEDYHVVDDNTQNEDEHEEIIDTLEGVSLPDDVDIEEQRMLLAAMTGEVYRGRVPDFATDPRYRPVQLSPGARSREQLRQEQDAAYHESLAADKRKAEEEERVAREKQEIEEVERRETERVEREAREAAEKLERTLTAKKASLPVEPGVGTEGAVQIVIRMPSGSRLSRRFHQEDELSVSRLLCGWESSFVWYFITLFEGIYVFVRKMFFFKLLIFLLCFVAGCF